ncbi:MAG: hypothetical protein WBP45_11070 [Daejeonella sp.]
MAKKTIKPAAREFRVVGVLPGLISFKGREYDLANLTEDQVAYLIEKKCPYVEWADETQVPTAE